ncbi:MAG TPA: RNA polymerase sigma factor [Armatimonadota bacterium]|nr:RNA polymerase sigma factor [Armatimonadota bacterium]
MREETDSQLVARARDGDLSAFEAIVDRHRAALVALAAGRLGSLADAEDVAQDAFVRAFFRLHQLRDPQALLPWLRRLTERLALMRRRRRREDLVAPERLEQMRRDHMGPGRPDDDGRIAELLQQLPTAMRQTVTLTYLAGYTCAETAALLGIRAGTVKSRLSRARATLKEAFTMARKNLSEGKPEDEFTQQTIERLMAEARRLLEQGDIDAAGERAGEVVGMQVRARFDSGDDSSVKIDKEAVRIYALPRKEQRRKDCEANAAQYGYRLQDLDWEVADVDMMSGTLGKPTGKGKDWWGMPHSRMRLRIMDARDICRRLRCSPVTLLEWVQSGLPILRCWPFARFDLDRVRQWLKDKRITDWPKETDYDLDMPIRVIFKALHRRDLTPEQAEEVITDLGWGVWG